MNEPEHNWLDNYNDETFRCCDDCGRSNRIYPEELTGADATLSNHD